MGECSRTMLRMYFKRCTVLLLGLCGIIGWMQLIVPKHISSRQFSTVTESSECPRIEHFENTSSVSETDNWISFIISNDALCKQSENLSLIILIHSKPDHFEHRRAIRNTWADYNAEHEKIVFRRIFLYGRVDSLELQKKLMNEVRAYSDILQSDFEDSYHNLYLNTLFGLKWVQTRCKNAKVVMKIDDDVMADMFNLIPQIILPYTKSKRRVFCNRLRNSRIFRNRTSKVFVEDNDFKDLKLFPPYCEGKTVIFTADLVKPLLDTAKNTNTFWIEDVYMYGVVLNKVPNVTFDSYKFEKEFDRRCFNTENCLKKDNERCQKILIGIRGKVFQNAEILWQQLTQRHASCKIEH